MPNFAINGVDVLSVALAAEFRSLVLERILDRILPSLPAGTITDEEITTIRREVVGELQRRFPDVGIDFDVREIHR
jgi:hypothetical protein